MKMEHQLRRHQETNETTSDPYGESDLKQRVGVAARVAAEAGEFKTLAFEKVLDHLLGPPMTMVADDVPEITPRSETSDKVTRRSAKRAVKPPTTPSLERIKPLLGVDGETVADWAEKIAKAPKKRKHHGVLIFARENGMDGLTLPRDSACFDQHDA